MDGDEVIVFFYGLENDLDDDFVEDDEDENGKFIFVVFLFGVVFSINGCVLIGNCS